MTRTKDIIPEQYLYWSTFYKFQFTLIAEG